MRIAIGNDHAGYELKVHLVDQLQKLGHELTDVGTHSDEPTDYPFYCIQVGRLVATSGADRGIVLGGSGQGEQIAANKVAGIRAALCNDIKTAALSRAHNDANVLALGARIVDQAEAARITVLWLETEFDGGRHRNRIDQILHYEQTGEINEPSAKQRD